LKSANCGSSSAWRTLATNLWRKAAAIRLIAFDERAELGLKAKAEAKTVVNAFAHSPSRKAITR
jgi:hypothetical protein